MFTFFAIATGCKTKPPSSGPSETVWRLANGLISTNEWKLIAEYQARSIELEVKEREARSHQRNHDPHFSQNWGRYLRDQIENVYPAEERMQDLTTLNIILERRLKAKQAEISVYRQYLLSDGDRPSFH